MSHDVMVYDVFHRMDTSINSHIQDWKMLTHISDIPNKVKICPGMSFM